MYKRIREALGMSIEELAGRLGESPDTIRNWETGVATPDDNVKALFSELDMKLRVFEKMKQASSQLDIPLDMTRQLASLRDFVKSTKGERLDVPVEDVLIEHLSFSIDDFLRNRGIAAADFPKSELAQHIYQNIKFLF